MPALGIGVPIDPDIVRWIEKRGVDPRPRAHHFFKERKVSSVTATDPVLARNPDVPRAGSWLDRNYGDNLIVWICLALQNHIDLAGREAGQGQIEVEIQFRELDLQQVKVPPGTEGDLVVGDAERTLLRFR